jgi:ribosomal protein L39E
MSHGDIERRKVELAVAARINAWIISFVAMRTDHGLFHRKGVGAFKV